MKRILFALLIVFVASVAIAENSESKMESKSEAKVSNVSLSGNVIDEVSGEALVGVEVKVEGTDKGHVLLLGLSTCIWCKKAKEFLESNNVQFEYVFVGLF